MQDQQQSRTTEKASARADLQGYIVRGLPKALELYPEGHADWLA